MADNTAVRVSTLELFFDLVFVFTVTQLTDVLVHHLDAVGVVRVLLMLGVIWWMYSGYAWLTNAVAPSSTTRRTLLLTGMGAFLVIALAIPDAFGASGWAFGAAYLVVSLMHTVLFLRADNVNARRAMRTLGPLNLTSAGLVMAGGLIAGPTRYAMWIGALALQIATPYLTRQLGWHTIRAGHFAERHSLVVIIAIGESIIAIGLGFAGKPVDLSVVAIALLGLCIAYYLWWAYFSGDEERAERVLATTEDPAQRNRLALWGWGYAHYPMILGIIVLSVGIKKTVGYAFKPLDWGPAIALGVGVALFLLGHAWFLRLLRLPGGWHRLAASAAVLATIPLGHVLAIIQLAVTPLAMAVPLIVEDLTRLRRSGERGTAVHTFGRTANHPPEVG
jgi:low temperature requirement protein LtrA